MADEFMRVEGNHLVPVNRFGEETIGKIPDGEILLVTFRKPRNPAFHRKFFALLRFAYENIDWEGQGVARPPFEAFREWILMKVGHSIQVEMPDGSRYEVAKSISFASMDDVEFASLYDSILDVVVEITTMTKENVSGIVDKLARFG